MVTFVHESSRVSVPGWVTNLDSFRRWTDEPEFPEEGRIWWLSGEVWIDMSKEQIFSHVLVKTELTMVLGTLAKSEKLGMYLTDGVLLSNFSAEISGNPDGLFLSTDTLAGDAIRFIEGKEAGYVELQGSPDMVLEIVSDSSLTKDRVVLKESYWKADVREYWVIDARNDPLVFDIFKRTAKGFSASRKRDGWVKSAVFGKSFRLSRTTNELGHPSYSLEHR